MMESRPVKYTCNICTLELSSSRQLYLHLRAVHYGGLDSPPGKTVKRARRDNAPGPILKCAICTEEFHTMRDLYRHLRGHFTTSHHDTSHRQGPLLKRRKVDSVAPVHHSFKRPQIGGGSRKRSLTGPSSSENPRKRAKTVITNPDTAPSTSRGTSKTKEVQLRLEGPHRLRMPTAQEMHQEQAGNASAVTDQQGQGKYHLVENSRRILKKLGAEEVTYRPILPDHLSNVRMLDALNSIYDMFNELVGKLKEDMHPNDKIRVVIQHPLLLAPLHVRAVPPQEFDTETIMAQVERLLQSEENLPIDEDLKINIATIKPQRTGRGRPVISLKAGFRGKRSIVMIQNEGDNLCMEKALTVALAKLDPKVNKKKWKKLIRSDYDNTYQHQKALELRRAASIPQDRKTTIQDLGKYEDLLDVQIIVIGLEELNEILYAGKEKRSKKVFLLQTDGHYLPILSIKGYLGVDNYCTNCLKVTDNRSHNCAEACAVCRSQQCRPYSTGASALYRV